MRVSLATHGGLAAAITLRQPPRVLDADTLRAEEAGDLRRLVADASAESAAPSPAGPARDAMSYTITVEEDGRTTTLTGSDTAMTAAFAELLTFLQRHTKR